MGTLGISTTHMPFLSADFRPPQPRRATIVDDVVYVNVASMRGQGQDYENPDLEAGGKTGIFMMMCRVFYF